MRTTAIPVAAALAALLAAPAAAGGKNDRCEHPREKEAAENPPAAPAPAAAATQIRFPDEALYDQDGRPVKLVSDVVGDRLVVMDFVFTSCTTICPLLSGIMSGVQEGLGDEGGDVSLVSVTVDPARDTPARLKAYAQKWKAKPGWTFLTGERDAVKRVLEAAGAYTADFTAHPPMVLVGDGKSGKWTRLNGFPKRTQVLAELSALRQRRAASATAEKGGPQP